MKFLRHLLAGFGAIALTALLLGLAPTDLVYYTNIERQPNGSRVVIQPSYEMGGGIWGQVWSNDTLLFQGGAPYHGRYFSAQNTFQVRPFEGNNQPQFDEEPYLGMDLLILSHLSQSIRGNANPYIPEGYGRSMTWIKLKGDNGIDIFQYPLGGVRQESLFTCIGPPNWQTIFVDGQCEIEGTLTGSLTIGSSGNMWLLDDVRYTNADRQTGDFDENDRRNGILRLFSEQDIIIKDTYRNGKENGASVNPADWNRHSIVITAAVITPNGSFTFEHQNNDWDMYQGPTPDERGWIYLKGCLIQNRRGLIHTSNHQGTGYGLSLRYDNRFVQMPPVEFEPQNQVVVSGDYNTLDLDTGVAYIFYDSNIGNLTIRPEHEVYFVPGTEVTIRHSLDIQGSEETPAHLRIKPFVEGTADLRFTGTGWNAVRIDHADSDERLDITISSDSCVISNCDLGGNLELSRNATVENSTLRKGVQFYRAGRGRLSKCLLLDGVEVESFGWTLDVVNNTFIGANGAAILLESGQNVRVVNNVIVDAREGIVCEGVEAPFVGYNLLYDIQRQNYFGCEAGEGALEADPLFVDQRSGDFRLTEDSPCIDAGDPASPRDPDGTVADLGAFWLDRGLGIGSGEDNPPYPPFNRRGGLPLEGLTASPNPFNATTVIRFEGSPINREATVRIFDLAGREVFSQAVNPLRLTVETESVSRGGLTPLTEDKRLTAETESVSRGGLTPSTETVTWDASAYPAGIYVVRVQNGSEIHSIKIVKVN